MFVAAALGAHSPAIASEGALSSIKACRTIADDRERLECLDRAAAGVEAASELDSELARREQEIKQREALLKAKNEAAESTGSLFGITFSLPKADAFNALAAGLPARNVERGADGVAEAITANIRRWSYDSDGHITIVLDNGQVWGQADSSEVHLAPGRTKPYRVRISRAALGSFMMTIEEKNKGYKMRRLVLGAR